MAAIGFMQGRLSALVNGRIQAFPWDEWREEFPRAAALGFPLMEWTLDAERLDENPLMTPTGRREIVKLSRDHGVTVGSLTGDFLMQASPLHASGTEQERRLGALERVIASCAALGIRYLVWPLVDQGRIASEAEAEALVSIVTTRLAPFLRDARVQLAFESDYPPGTLRALIDRFPEDLAGINYDTGNSASLGFRPGDEVAAYGNRITNVHVKDRLLGGTTVPLGTGAAVLPAAFHALRACGYPGAYILQTARATNGDHAEALRRYRDLVHQLLSAA